MEDAAKAGDTAIVKRTGTDDKGCAKTLTCVVVCDKKVCEVSNVEEVQFIYITSRNCFPLLLGKGGPLSCSYKKQIRLLEGMIIEQ